jgi:7-cyano-7-deazaguanine synthase
MPWKGSSLLDKRIKLPITDYRLPIAIPSTYVPARNTIFLSFGLSFAEAVGAGSVFIGANALDYSGYPDCRPAYFHAFRRLARVATKSGVEHKKIAIVVPLLYLKKSQIIKWGKRLNVPYHLTWSCYRGGKKPCGRCDSCLLRVKGFKEAGMTDPLLIR